MSDEDPPEVAEHTEVITKILKKYKNKIHGNWVRQSVWLSEKGNEL